MQVISSLNLSHERSAVSVILYLENMSWKAGIKYTMVLDAYKLHYNAIFHLKRKIYPSIITH